MKLSERDRNAAFALLIVLAVGVIIYDVRGADQQQVTSAYQCGVDIISKGRFAGMALENIACDESGCLSASTEGNGTSQMTFEQAKRKLESIPYILIKTGESPSYSFFQRHMEIVIGKDTGNTTQCDIVAKES